jgi:hypothetical protein
MYGSGGTAPLFLTPNTKCNSASHPSIFTAGTHCGGGWVGPRVSLGVKEKFLTLLGIEPRISGRLHRSLVVILTELHSVTEGSVKLKKRKSS